MLIPNPPRIWPEQYQTVWLQYEAVSLLNRGEQYEQYNPCS
jgi:hypothetical protein